MYGPVPVIVMLVGMMLAIATVQSVNASTQSSESRFIKWSPPEVAMSLWCTESREEEDPGFPFGDRTSRLKLSRQCRVWSQVLALETWSFVPFMLRQTCEACRRPKNGALTEV